MENFLKQHGGKQEFLDLYLKLTYDILLGLITLHTNSQMHRDIAPKNIFLQGEVSKPQEMAAKLGDFGVSRGFNSNEISKGIVSYLGTPYYWSPERLKNKSYN